MTFDDIVAEICERLNYTSAEATTRVGKRVNSRYKRITSSIGLSTSRYVQISAKATIGNRTIRFNGIEKILAVVDKSSGKDIPLVQVTLDEMHITPERDGVNQPPRKYAVVGMHPNSVEIYMDGVPATAYTLYADGIQNVGTLSGSMSPDLPESFHDILVFGGLADEYRKLEKFPLAEVSEKDFEQRLSDLRMFIAKSAYLDIYAGRYAGKNFRWTRDAQTSWDE